MLTCSGYKTGIFHTPHISSPSSVFASTSSVPTKMKFQQCIVVVLAMMFSMCCGHIGGGNPLQDVNPQVYCGRSLARALALLCFDESGYDKRSDVGTMYSSILAPYYKDQEQLGWPWMAPHKARSMGLPSRGKRYPGIVNECCDKACSINELLTYC